MPITLQRTTPTTILVRGIPLGIAGRTVWRKMLRQIGKELQERVAKSYGRQRVMGSRWLRKNTPEYDASKRRQGFDRRRGHRTNQLQRALDTRKLYSVSSITAQGTCTIKMREDWLRNWVPHAEYYAEGSKYHNGKVPGGKIMAVARKWVDDVRATAQDFEARITRNAVSRTVTAGGSVAVLRGRLNKAALNANVRRLIADYEKARDFERRAPFAGRPQRIKPTAGLSQAQMMKLSRQSQKAIAEAGKLDELERLIKRAERGTR